MEKQGNQDVLKTIRSIKEQIKNKRPEVRPTYSEDEKLTRAIVTDLNRLLKSSQTMCDELRKVKDFTDPFSPDYGRLEAILRTASMENKKVQYLLDTLPTRYK